MFSQLTGPGGIPYAGRQAGAVLASFARERGMKCRILGLNDPARAEAIALGDIAFPVTGFEGSKTRLAKEVLSAALGVRLAYFGHCGLAPLGLALTMRPGAGYLVAGHGIEVWRRLPMLEGLAFRNARAISAPSRYTANQIQRHNGIPAERLFVVPWGLDPGFEARTGGNGRRPPLPAGRLLLTVSRLDATERYKGVESVLRAMPELLRKIPDVSYVVVGEGDDRPRLEAIARAAGVFEHVHFTGRMSDDEVAFYHAAADVYVMPSRKEGLGLVFLEAMACGKPVVAAAEAAAPEVVIDGETGFLVGYDDVEALSDRLGILLSDAELRARMGEAGRRRFEQNYTFARFQRRLADLLSAELIDSPRPRSFTGND